MDCRAGYGAQFLPPLRFQQSQRLVFPYAFHLSTSNNRLVHAAGAVALEV